MDRDQRGATIMELLALLAVLAVLAGVVVFVVSGANQRSAEAACRSERRIIASAIESARLANQRGEFPPVAGPDGLDAVRVSGFLDYEPPVASFWAYTSPPGGTVDRPRFERVNLTRVPLGACPD
ncbi:MAG: hypothetical protein ACOYOP_13115 [Microthrixaceae bacterium]